MLGERTRLEQVRGGWVQSLESGQNSGVSLTLNPGGRYPLCPFPRKPAESFPPPGRSGYASPSSFPCRASRLCSSPGSPGILVGPGPCLHPGRLVPAHESFVSGHVSRRPIRGLHRHHGGRGRQRPTFRGLDGFHGGWGAHPSHLTRNGELAPPLVRGRGSPVLQLPAGRWRGQHLGPADGWFPHG